jgi:23S rRNA U2552 (ribose-2'-O)-methylase RlmE/FtsJ
MESKQIFLFPCLEQNANDETNDNLQHVNEKLHDVLLKYKDLINEYHSTRTWDKYKKLANDFELVSSSFGNLPYLTHFHSISRSYYKLWEIFHDIDISFVQSTKPLTCAFLAEGPGGFIESFVNLRKKYAILSTPDNIYGMTLLSTNRSVPSWKLTQPFLQEHNIKLLSGEDKTGSLYKIDNIIFLKDTIGENACDLVTCDGGFDFSRDYNIQEEVSSHLITCEVYATLMIQKIGGTAIIKVFDICNVDTMSIIHILCTSYQHVYITKPHTSRPANSEKYIVCQQFLGCNNDIMSMLQNHIQKKLPLNSASMPSSVTRLSDLLPAIVNMNKYFISKQIHSIVKAITMIEESDKVDIYSTKCHKDSLHRQIEFAIRWCHKYNVGMNINVLHQYLSLVKIPSDIL